MANGIKGITVEIGGDTTKLSKVLVGKNAMSGFLAIMNAASSDISKLSDAINNCDGTALRMAETMKDNLEGQVTILKSKVKFVSELFMKSQKEHSIQMVSFYLNRNRK